MSAILTSTNCLAQWGRKISTDAEHVPAGSWDGRIVLPEWLMASAREQAERVFLVLDGTPVEQRDMGEAERLIEASIRAVLTAWADLMEAFGTGNEPWAIEVMKVAAQGYADRLDELSPSLHAGGRA